MEKFQVYRDIQARTGGDIYIGCRTRPHRKIHIYPQIHGDGCTARDGTGKTGRGT